jgi:hypothetical protein
VASEDSVPIFIALIKMKLIAEESKAKVIAVYDAAAATYNLG